MRRHALAIVAILTSTLFARGAADSVIDKGDRDALSDMFSQWFGARAKSNEDPKQLKAQVKAYDDLKGKLADIQKKKKIDPLASPAELRSVMSTPWDPEKTPQKGRLWERDVEPGNKKGSPKYLLWLPKNYSVDVPTPIVVALHPPLKKAEDVKKWATEAFPAAISDVAMIVIPVNAENPIDWNSEPGHARVLVCIAETAKHFHVDRLRVFLDGDGAAAPAAVGFATAFPSMLTGVIVRRPESAPPSDQLENLRAMKIQIVAPTDEAMAKTANAFAEDAKAKGVEATVTSSQFGGVGSAGDAGTQAIASFVTSTTKNLTPKKLRFLAKARGFDAYWLHADGDIPKTGMFWIEAEVFKETNEIKISSPQGLRSFQIFLNDDVVDMGKSVKVLYEVVKKDAEGKETREGPKVCFEGTKPRKLDYVLDKWFWNPAANYGEVYTYFIDVSL